MSFAVVVTSGVYVVTCLETKGGNVLLRVELCVELLRTGGPTSADPPFSSSYIGKTDEVGATDDVGTLTVAVDAAN